jgi:hypothetical protein
MSADPVGVFVPSGMSREEYFRAIAEEERDLRDHELRSDWPDLTEERVDLSLIDYTLSLSPMERLLLLQWQIWMQSPLWVRASRLDRRLAGRGRPSAG